MIAISTNRCRSAILIGAIAIVCSHRLSLLWLLLHATLLGTIRRVLQDEGGQLVPHVQLSCITIHTQLYILSWFK